MLLTTIRVTETTEQVEMKLPAYFYSGTFSRHIMICADESIIQVQRDFISLWESGGAVDKLYRETLASTIASAPSTEEEFFNAYNRALARFQKSLIPSPEKISV